MGPPVHLAGKGGTMGKSDVYRWHSRGGRAPRSVAVWRPSRGLAAPASAAPLTRVDDPVVMTGATIPQLQGIAPYESSPSAGRAAGPSCAGRRAPADRHQRGLRPGHQLRRPRLHLLRQRQCFGQPANGVEYVNYTDPDTWVGPDTDTTLDADDEVALMVKDTGACGSGSAAGRCHRPGRRDQGHRPARLRRGLCLSLPSRRQPRPERG